MLKSNLIPMISQGKQLTVANLAVAYVYATDGPHVDGGSTTQLAAQIKFYGHNKTGPVFIAKGHLVTDAAYDKGEAASCVITDVPVKDEYPFMTWELVPGTGAFVRLESQPQLGIAVSDATEHLSTTIKEQADVVEADA